MIKTIHTNLLHDIPDYSVILHQVNCQGMSTAGQMSQIIKRFPDWFQNYHGYCGWFRDGHENEILGTFHRYDVNPKLIICSAFAQIGISRAKQVTNYEAWEKICRNVERQTRLVNEKMRLNWKIHIPYNIGSNFEGGNISAMMDIFEFYFKDSPVELWIHDTRQQ